MQTGARGCLHYAPVEPDALTYVDEVRGREQACRIAGAAKDALAKCAG